MDQNVCPVDPIHGESARELADAAANLLRSVGTILHLGGLPKFHDTRYSGDSCFQAADQLANLGGV